MWRCAVLTPKQQSYREISKKKCLGDGKLLRCAAFTPKIEKGWWEDRAGVVVVGAAAVMGPGGDGSSTASLLSLSTGVPTPRRVPVSPRGPGVSATCTSGRGWWAAAFPRGWPICRMDISSGSILCLFSCLLWPRGTKCPQIHLLQAARQLLLVMCWVRFPVLFSHPRSEGSSGFWQSRFAGCCRPQYVLTVTHGLFVQSSQDLRRAMNTESPLYAVLYLDAGINARKYF